MDALHLMTELARSWPELRRAAELSEKTTISLQNVKKTVHDLSRAGMVVATRGRGGGVRLAHVASSIRISDIIRAFEPKDCPISFISNQKSAAKIDHLIFKAHRAFFQPLETTLLSDLE